MHNPDARAALVAGFQAVRAHTAALIEGLSDEDCGAQSMADASPLKWHLAHTTWFFETFLLERFEPGFQPFHPAFRILFNSYYNGVGDKHPRPQRGLLTRPALSDVRAYRANVEARMLALLTAPALAPELPALVELGLQHEQQHQELMQTDFLHLLSMNPLRPAWRAVAPVMAPATAPVRSLEWQRFEGGIVHIGHEGTGFCFDNELPRHRQFLEPYALASRLVTNGEYLGFIEAGGYRDSALWLSEGWDWVRANGVQMPLYWSQDDQGWREFSEHGEQRLDPQRPALHLSYFEADAFARWAGARLPTEAEWEHAAGQGRLAQMQDTAWQWTSSSYAPYPGYAPAAGAIGEYNGKFMSNQYVLRGASCATPPGHARASYRNFFPATARWQYSGIRLAKSA